MAGHLVARERGELRQGLDWKLFYVLTVRAESEREKRTKYDENKNNCIYFAKVR